jgi:uncharacterized coiled-coil protein SlyX
MFSWAFERKVRQFFAEYDRRLEQLEERSTLVEKEMGRHLRQLNTVLNGLATINQRLVKEATDPSVAVENLRKSGPYRTLIKRIKELDDDVSTWWEAIKSTRLGLERLEQRVAKLEGDSDDDLTSIYSKDEDEA